MAAEYSMGRGRGLLMDAGYQSDGVDGAFCGIKVGYFAIAPYNSYATGSDG
jgi:hypothetical protein